MYQKVTLIGRLGSEPETRSVGSTSVCSFSLATNEKWKDQNGQQQERTTWWRVSAWGRLGEVCQQYLSKGRKVFIEGTITVDPETGGPRIWTDKDGKPRANLELRAAEVKFIDSANGNGSNGNGHIPVPVPTAAETVEDVMF